MAFKYGKMQKIPVVKIVIPMPESKAEDKNEKQRGAIFASIHRHEMGKGGSAAKSPAPKANAKPAKMPIPGKKK